MMSWVDPHPFNQVDPHPFNWVDPHPFDLRVWIDSGHHWRSGLYILVLSIAYTVTQRHWLLEKTIGTMQIEDKAFETIWITILFSLIVFIVGPILSCFIFKKANSSLHPCFGIIAEEAEKEQQKSKRKGCGIFSLFLKFRHAQAFTSEH